MNGRKLILADGTTYMEGECGQSEEFLWCWLPIGTDITKIFSDFTNPEKTARITFEYSSESITYEGYTVFRGLLIDSNGMIKVRIKKEI